MNRNLRQNSFSILAEVVERITIDENGLATFVVRGGSPIQRRKTVVDSLRTSWRSRTAKWTPKSTVYLDDLGNLRALRVDSVHGTRCAIRQILHQPNGGFRTTEFTGVEVNRKFPANTFDLPKGAKRVRMN